MFQTVYYYFTYMLHSARVCDIMNINKLFDEMVQGNTGVLFPLSL